MAIGVYDSSHSWGKQDRGIQLCYRFYAFRPHRIKLLDEQEFGGGRFVTARVGGGGRLTWKNTQVDGSNS